MKKRGKVLLIFCGGTTLFPEKVGLRAVRKKEDIPGWMKNVEEVKMIADLNTHFIFGKEASDVGAREWIKISETIQKNYKKYDGFIITHGIETLPYTAAMLSFMLRNLGKPVIITGSPVPSKEENSAEILESIFKNFKGLGVKANIINACQVAISEISGVLVIFGSRIISGTQLEKLLTSSLNFFEAYNNRIVGKIDFGLTLFDQKLKRHHKKPIFSKTVDPRVSIFDFHPGVDFSLLKNTLAQNISGLIIKTQSTSFFPEKVYALLKKAKRKKIPIVVYSTGGFKRIKEEEFIYIDNMSFVTCVIKLMWVLGQTKNIQKIRRMMLTDYTGEMLKRDKI